MKPQYPAGGSSNSPFCRIVRLVASVLVVSALAAAPAWSQEGSDDLPGTYPDDGREGVEADDVARSYAPPPRTLDDITQALQRYKPGPRKAEQDRAAAQAAVAFLSTTTG